MSVPQRRIELSLVSFCGRFAENDAQTIPWKHREKKDEPATERSAAKQAIDRPRPKKCGGKDGETLWKRGRKIEVRTEESALDVGNGSKHKEKTDRKPAADRPLQKRRCRL